MAISFNFHPVTIEIGDDATSGSLPGYTIWLRGRPHTPKVYAVNVGTIYRWEQGKGQVEVDDVRYAYWDGECWSKPAYRKEDAEDRRYSEKQDFPWRAA